MHPLLKSKGSKPRKGSVVTCGFCSKEFYASPSLAKQKYCTRRCAHKGMIKGSPLDCKICGTSYYRPPSQIKWRGTGFCSKTCKGKNLSMKQIGSKNPQWKGGISSPNRRLRASKAFRIWRESVFKRDNHTCQDCGARSKAGEAVYLEPHHILRFADYPDFRFETINGKTLCQPCHRKVTYGMG